MFEDVVKVAMDIPLFAGRSAAEISVERLGGQTNSNYLVSVGGSKYVLRIAGAGTETIINRKSDAANSRLASEIGVSTQVLFVDENTGVMLREFVEGTALENEDFRNLEKIDHAARALRLFMSTVTLLKLVLTSWKGLMSTKRWSGRRVDPSRSTILNWRSNRMGQGR